MSQTTVSSDRDLTVPQTLRTAAFWFLWVTWALAGAAGIAMIPLSMSFGLARGLDINQAVLILTAFNLANGLSRPASGYLSDIIGRNITMSMAFLAGGCAYFLMPLLNGLAGWCLLAVLVGYAFGRYPCHRTINRGERILPIERLSLRSVDLRNDIPGVFCGFYKLKKVQIFG